jgi:hypothetical protein
MITYKGTNICGTSMLIAIRDHLDIEIDFDEFIRSMPSLEDEYLWSRVIDLGIADEAMIEEKHSRELDDRAAAWLDD